jgi:putative flippase GtrA
MKNASEERRVKSEELKMKDEDLNTAPEAKHSSFFTRHFHGVQLPPLSGRVGERPLLHSPLTGEIIRFGVVGVIATAIQYLVYWVLIHWINPAISLPIGYVVSFIFNFFASTKFTFRVKANVKHGAGFAFSHIINMTMQVVLLKLFLFLGISEQLAPIPVFCICIPTNFILVRFFLKR